MASKTEKNGEVKQKTTIKLEKDKELEKKETFTTIYIIAGIVAFIVIIALAGITYSNAKVQEQKAQLTNDIMQLQARVK